MAAAALGAQAFLQFQSAQNEASAIERESAFTRQQLNFNKKIATIQAEDALERGEQDVAAFKKQAEGIKGSQKAALAAQGIEVDSGSAAQIQYETDKEIDTNIKRIKNNAWREAWGYKTEAVNLSTQAAFEKISAKNRAESTLLRGGLEATGTLIQAGQSAFGGKGK